MSRGYQLAPQGTPAWSCFSHPQGVERQTAEEKAFGDFIINGPDTAYGMMDFTYEPKEFDRLVTLSRYNVLNNMETIRHALQLALDQRLRQRQAGGRDEG